MKQPSTRSAVQRLGVLALSAEQAWLEGNYEQAVQLLDERKRLLEELEKAPAEPELADALRKVLEIDARVMGTLSLDVDAVRSSLSSERFSRLARNAYLPQAPSEPRLLESEG